MATLQLENKTARILHIGLGGGKNLAVPPMETGGIVVEMSDAEKAAFDKALATEEVASWVEAGVLVVTEKVPEPPPPEGGEGEGGAREAPPGLPPAETLPVDPEPPPEVPEFVRRGKRARDE